MKEFFYVKLRQTSQINSFNNSVYEPPSHKVSICQMKGLIRFLLNVDQARRSLYQNQNLKFVRIYHVVGYSLPRAQSISKIVPSGPSF